ncbi:transmembrane channel-like protein 5 isoform X1 [Synchiropus splendidus]|uniref:transmembrane channel-like protein 5 isoform X1 n=1 Tax=Synchiropus splendidus TaxID=270530 RepID=UPI00237DB418|nr:transmembrane channel-like protein 5 isoform X1 [Synchiropus splendidus]XP_053712093.1 transmembrane channel-like protein 5 isoform X1 [Synchiropus splendidus]
MSRYSNGGVFNPAYHDSETLELDRSNRGRHHTNPYAGEDPARWNHGAAAHHYPTGQSRNDGSARVPWGGWQEESWRGRESIPMGLLSTRPESPGFQHDFSHSTFQINSSSQYDGFSSTRLPLASTAGHMTMRWRGAGMRRMGMFPDADPAHAAFTEEAIRSEMENEEQDLVKELVGLSTNERVSAIRNLPMTFEEKKHIRHQVLAFKSSKREFTCFSDCTENISLSLRRCDYSLRSARQSMELWQGTFKEIGGRFGTSVLSYFLFLKWLLLLNIISFLVNFGFITIPLLVYDHTPNVPANLNFRGLEILTGAGYFNYTVMYYGGYSNETLSGTVEYNMQLAYFFTISVYMVLCGFTLIYSMASSFKTNYVLVGTVSNSAWQLLCSWDFSLTNERAVRLRRSNLRVQLKESLSEKAQRNQLTNKEKLKHYGIHLGSWLLSTGLAVGCAASVYFLCQFEGGRTTDDENWTLIQEAETLLVPFVVSLINLVIPLFYSLFNKFECYSSQRRQIYALVLRNVILKMFVLGILCHYWMHVVAQNFSCWESMVGQALYRLVIFDFLFLMLGSLFGEFLSNVIGTRVFPRLGVPEFDVARNVLELTYSQTLAWIGIYFSPLLPAIQILKYFLLFYLKKVSLTRNCQPPRRSGRAAQMKTIFIALLFFPFFVGALSVVGYTSWSLIPSQQCGPFRGLNNTFSVVGHWIDDLEGVIESEWVVWIYKNVIKSEIFYFLCTLIILVVIYIFWQVTQGRKQLISLLRQQIVNEGKDKSFLLEKLRNMQQSQPDPKPKQKKQRHHKRQDDPSSSGQSNSNAVVQGLFARQQLEEKERSSHGGVLVPSDLSPSSALAQAMAARQRATSQNQFADPEMALGSAGYTVTQVRHREEDVSGSSVSSVMMQVMQARQRVEEEDGMQWVSDPAHTSSSALIQAMLARQQAQNEFDDGY